MANTLDAAMLQNAGKSPASIAWQDPNGQLARGQLAVTAFAASKRLNTATEAECVGICLPSIKEYGLAFFAVLLAGKTVVPINFLLQPNELMHVLKDSGIDTIITSDYFVEKLTPLGVNLITIEAVGAELAQTDLSQLTPSPAQEPNECAVMLYTSGTTALPKGVRLSHQNLLAQADMAADFLDLENYHLLSPLPLFHTFALTVCVVLPAITPLRVSLLPRFNPLEIVDAMKQFGTNVIVGVPSMHRMVVRAAAKKGLKGADFGLILGVAGGERLPPDIYDEYQSLLGVELVEGFGMTEHSPIIAVNPVGKSRPGYAGLPLKGVEIRTVDGEGNPVAVGEEGELQIRSASVMMGYNNYQDQPIKDGWLASGDLAKIDSDGFLKITGRIKELIISAGKNIHPAEVEDVVLEYADVKDCGVIAMPDKTRGEAVACFYTMEEGADFSEDDLKDWLRDKIADYKMPRFIKRIDEMPTTMTGKVLRRGLTEFLPTNQAS